MDIEKTKKLKYPKSIIFVYIAEFGFRFAALALRTMLAVYFVEVLLYDERTSTAVLHTHVMLCYLFSCFGSIMCDTRFGNLKTAVCAASLTAFGLLMFSTATIERLHLPVRELSMVALFLTSIGTGTVIPSITALGAAHFVLPQQQAHFSSYFTYMLFWAMSGQVAASFITPILRKDVTCFDQNSCYPLAFLCPAVIGFIAAGLLIIDAKCHKPIKSSNAVLKVIRCIIYAVREKIKSKENREHWLDYADTKFDSQLIENVKNMFKIGKLLIPFCAYYALGTQTYSSWVFQAMRMNGEIPGYVLKPDQIQIFEPVIFVILCPIFHKLIFPLLNKYTMFNTILKQLTLGGLIGALAFIISGILELKLESTQAKLPENGLAQIRFFNTLNCNVTMTVDNQIFVLQPWDMWQNISVPAHGKISLNYETDLKKCDFVNLSHTLIAGQITADEMKATSWAVTEKGLSYKYADRVDKSKSGTPLLRALVYVDESFTSSDAALRLENNGKIYKNIIIPKSIRETDLIKVDHGYYDIFLGNVLVENNVPIMQGGVYTVVGSLSNSNRTTGVHTVTVTEPNSVHMFWLIPQLVTLSSADVMVNVKGPEFIYAEGPQNIKTSTYGFWLLYRSLGGLIIIIVTKANFFQRKIFDILLFTVIMITSMLIFTFLTKSYTKVTVSGDNSQRKIKLTKQDLNNEETFT